MDREGLVMPHVVEQQEVKINIERGKLEIRIDTKIHSMEWLVMTMDTKPSKGHVWTPAKNDVFRYEEIVAPNT
jgi:hypothetical protein